MLNRLGFFLAILFTLAGCERECPQADEPSAASPPVAPAGAPAGRPNMDLTAVKNPTVLGIDMVLMALIGKPGCTVEIVIEEAENGQLTPVITDLALQSAMSSIRPGDKVDHARFSRLLRYAEIRASQSRQPGKAFDPPSPEEIAHWRKVALGDDE